MCLSKLTVRPACQIHNSHTDRSVGHTTRHGLWATFAEFGRRHWLLGITLWKEERRWVNGVCSAAVSSLHWIIQIEKTAVAHLSSVWYWTQVEGEDTALLLKPAASFELRLLLSCLCWCCITQMDDWRKKVFRLAMTNPVIWWYWWGKDFQRSEWAMSEEN